MKACAAVIACYLGVMPVVAESKQGVNYVEKFETNTLVTGTDWWDRELYLKKHDPNAERLAPGFYTNIERDGYINVWLAAIFSASAFEPQIRPFFESCVRRTRNELFSIYREPGNDYDAAKKQLTKTKRDEQLRKTFIRTLHFAYSAPEAACGIAPFQFLVAMELVDPFKSPGLEQIPSISKDWRVDPNKRGQYAESLRGLFDRVITATRDLTPEGLELLKLSMQVGTDERLSFLVNLNNMAKKQDIESLSAWAAELNGRLTGGDPKNLQAAMMNDPKIRGLFNVLNNVAANNLGAYLQPSHPLTKEVGYTLNEWLDAQRFTQYRYLRSFPQSNIAKYAELDPIYQMAPAFEVLAKFGCKEKHSTIMIDGPDNKLSDISFKYVDCRK